MERKLSYQDSLPLREHTGDLWMSMRAQNLSEKTIHDYQDIWRPFEAWLARETDEPRPNLAAFTMRNVQAYLVWQQRPDRPRPLADSSLETIARTLKAISSRLHNDGKTGTNRLENLPGPKAAETDGRVLTEEEQRALFARASGLTVMARCSTAMLAVLADVGPRVSELVSLDAKDVDFDKHHITLGHPAKRGFKRILPLGRVSQQLIREYLGRRRTGPLFVDRDGKRMTDDAVRNRLVRLSSAVAIERVSPHDFRRTAATTYDALGASEAQSDKVFGWKPNPRAKRRYIFLTPEQIVAAHRDRLSPLDFLDPLRHRRARAA